MQLLGIVFLVDCLYAFVLLWMIKKKTYAVIHRQNFLRLLGDTDLKMSSSLFKVIPCLAVFLLQYQMMQKVKRVIRRRSQFLRDFFWGKVQSFTVFTFFNFPPIHLEGFEKNIARLRRSSQMRLRELKALQLKINTNIVGKMDKILFFYLYIFVL